MRACQMEPSAPDWYKRVLVRVGAVGCRSAALRLLGHGAGADD